VNDKLQIERLAASIGINLSVTVRPGFIARIGSAEARGATEGEALGNLRSLLTTWVSTALLASRNIASDHESRMHTADIAARRMYESLGDAR